MQSGESAVERAARIQQEHALATIKRREQNVRDAIRRGEPTVDAGPFAQSQLGLQSVVADQWGRLWRCDGTDLVMVYSPEWKR